MPTPHLFPFGCFLHPCLKRPPVHAALRCKGFAFWIDRFLTPYTEGHSLLYVFVAGLYSLIWRRRVAVRDLVCPVLCHANDIITARPLESRPTEGPCDTSLRSLLMSFGWTDSSPMTTLRIPVMPKPASAAPGRSPCFSFADLCSLVGLLHLHFGWTGLLTHLMKGCSMLYRWSQWHSLVWRWGGIWLLAFCVLLYPHMVSRPLTKGSFPMFWDNRTWSHCLRLPLSNIFLGFYCPVSLLRPTALLYHIKLLSPFLPALQTGNACGFSQVLQAVLSLIASFPLV